MPRLGIAVLFFCCFFITACLTPQGLSRYNSEPNKSKNQNIVELGEVNITPKRNDYFNTIPTKLIDILHADLEVSFNWGKHECIGTETLLLKPYFYETDSIVLDAKSMTFSEIVILDNENSPIQYLTTYDKLKLRIKLERKISAQDSVKVMIRYIAKPNELEDAGGKAIKNNKGLYFINTDHSEPYKPTQIWTQGEAEASSCWFPTIDQVNEKFTLKISITVNKDFTTLSNGKLILSTINGVLKTDVWESKKPLPAYLVMMAISDFKVTKDYLITTTKDSFITMEYDTLHIQTYDSLLSYRDSIIPKRKVNYRDVNKDLLNGVEVSYYLEPEYSPYALSIFKHTPEMIDFFAAKLGVDYPWDKYAQSVVRDFVAGAMENTSATLHYELVQKNTRQLLDDSNDEIISHELFHQWFGDLVTCKSWSHLVLNEGFATYGEYLWQEYKYGAEEALMGAYATVNQYLNYAKNNNDDPIIQFNYKDPDDMFNVITYQKGALVLHLLRKELGDEAFFLTLKNYLNNYAYQNADIDDLRREFESVTGKDLRQFFSQWFLKDGHPIIELRYDYNDTSKLLGVTIEQKQSNAIGLYNFPLTFKVTQASQTKCFTFQIQKRIETFFVQKFDTSSQEYPNVFVDPEAIFIGEIKDNKPFINHIKSYYNGTNYVEKVRSLKALNELKGAVDTARAVLLTAINDPNYDIRSKAIDWTDWSDPRNLTPVKSILISMANSDPSVKVRISATKALSQLKDATLFNTLVNLTNDSSYTVAGHALLGVYKLIPAEAILLCHQLEKDAKANLFSSISNIYAKSGTLSNSSFFENYMMKVSNRMRPNLIDNYANFCILINQDGLYTRAISLLTERAYQDKSGLVRVEAISALEKIYQFQLSELGKEKNTIRKNERQMALSLFKSSIQRIVDQEIDEDAIEFLNTKGFTKTP